MGDAQRPALYLGMLFPSWSWLFVTLERWGAEKLHTYMPMPTLDRTLLA
jgi:hypothetical protein